MCVCVSVFYFFRPSTNSSSMWLQLLGSFLPLLCYTCSFQEVSFPVTNGLHQEGN